jgi:hypothetical protein
MKPMLIGLMVLACSALPSCATVQSATGLTPAQNLYRAHGVYNIALNGAVTYAESKFADKKIVQAMTDANRSAKPAFDYAEAVVACAGPDNSGNLVITVANARCKALDISPGTINKEAGILDKAKDLLLNLLKKGS